MKSELKIDFHEFVVLAAAALAPDEYWVITHADGLLEDTASKDVTVPVRVFCEALNCDWDEARESGYSITRAKLPGRRALVDGGEG